MRRCWMAEERKLGICPLRGDGGLTCSRDCEWWSKRWECCLIRFIAELMVAPREYEKGEITIYVKPRDL